MDSNATVRLFTVSRSSILVNKDNGLTFINLFYNDFYILVIILYFLLISQNENILVTPITVFILESMYLVVYHICISISMK